MSKPILNITKSRLLIAKTLALPLFFSPFAHSGAFVGYAGADIDTNGAWRTNSVVKPMDADGNNNRRQVAVIPQVWQNFDRKILKGIAAYVRECCNWAVFVEEIEHQRLPDLRSTHFDGFIVNFDSRSVAQALRGITVPIVAYGGGGGWHDPASGVPYVATDDEAIGRLAAEHLLDLGLSQFGFCGYPQNRTNTWMEVRKRAFVGRLEQSGHECHVYCGRHSTASQWWKIQAGLCHWLRELPLPVGLMGCYDYRARHVLEACKTVGLRVPDDVALIGVDNVYKTWPVPLSYVYALYFLSKSGADSGPTKHSMVQNRSHEPTHITSHHRHAVRAAGRTFRRRNSSTRLARRYNRLAVAIGAAG